MDMHCFKCGEPWDIYGLWNGSVAVWEADLIWKGAGCPCCEGIPDTPYEPTVSDLEGWDDYPQYTPPPYEKPDPVVMFVCAKCGPITVDPDEIFYNGRGKKLFPDYTPGSHEVDGFTLCDECFDSCTWECGGCGNLYFEDDEDTVWDGELMQGFHAGCYEVDVSRCGHCERSINRQEEELFDVSEYWWAKNPEGGSDWVCSDCLKELTARYCAECDWEIDCDDTDAVKTEDGWICRGCQYHQACA